MGEEKEKVVEKHYIETNPTLKSKFLQGIVGGLGWGVGITIGTAAFIALFGFFVSQINFVPILGQFFADVIKSAQQNIR